MGKVQEHLSRACDEIDQRFHAEKLGWPAYERRWIDGNPSATPREFEAAMRRIAGECGV